MEHPLCRLYHLALSNCIYNFLNFLAAAHGGLFVQDGQEYVYHSSATSTAGTLDHSPHMSGSNYKMKVRVQVSGKNLNVEVSILCVREHS